MQKFGRVKRALATAALVAGVITTNTGLVSGLVVQSPVNAAPKPTPPKPSSTPAVNAHYDHQPLLPGVKVTNVRWFSDRRVSLWVYSPAMGTNIQVQLLLARDWNVNPTARFPQLYKLDGLRATDISNGWLKETDAEAFYKDKNVNVVMPVGGESSLYTDWKEPDRGKNYQWETFLIRELPPILEGKWRSTSVRAIEGLSMGGTGAMMLAVRQPGFFKFVGAFSSVLQTSAYGMPEAIQFALKEGGDYDSAKMFGPPSDPNWVTHDPYVNIEKLRGTSLYISTGNGMVGKYDTPSDIPGLATNYAGVGLEVLARITTQRFATKLNQLGIAAQAVYRESGTHSWPYWQFEMHQAWPQVASVLHAGGHAPCKPVGAIADAVKGNRDIGECLTAEYNVPGGRAQDFRNGRVMWSERTKAHIVAGSIGGAYVGAGGSGGYLGLPVDGEKSTPVAGGKFQTFERGTVYWTENTGAHAVTGEILKAWGKAGFERGQLGFPTGDEIATPNKKGRVQAFQKGAYYFSAPTGAHAVQGKILEKYGKLDFEDGWLGLPRSDEVALTRGGRITVFEGGNIYWTQNKGAFAIPRGPVFDAWGKAGFENGKLGYPVSDQVQIPGGSRVSFEHGVIEVINGVITVK